MSEDKTIEQVRDEMVIAAVKSRSMDLYSELVREGMEARLKALDALPPDTPWNDWAGVRRFCESDEAANGIFDFLEMPYDAVITHGQWKAWKAANMPTDEEMLHEDDVRRAMGGS